MKPTRIARLLAPVACLALAAGCTSSDKPQPPTPGQTGSSSSNTSVGSTEGATGPGSTDTDSTDTDSTATGSTDTGSTGTGATGVASSTGGSTGDGTGTSTAAAGGVVTHARSGLAFSLPEGWRATGSEVPFARAQRANGVTPNLIVTMVGGTSLPTQQQLTAALQGKMRVEDVGRIDTPVGPGMLASTAGDVQGIQVRGALLVVVGPKGATTFVVTDSSGGSAKRTATTIARSLKAG